MEWKMEEANLTEINFITCKSWMCILSMSYQKMRDDMYNIVGCKLIGEKYQTLSYPSFQPEF